MNLSITPSEIESLARIRASELMLGAIEALMRLIDDGKLNNDKRVALMKEFLLSEKPRCEKDMRMGILPKEWGKFCSQ